MGAWALGCATSSKSDRAFSPEWAYQNQRESEFQKRREYTREKDKDPAGARGGKNMAVPPSEKTDSPGMRIGKPTGLGADLGMGGGTVGYKVKW